MTGQWSRVTAQELTVMALREAGEIAVADVVEATGSTLKGWPMLGLLGWLPFHDLRAACKAAQLAHTSLRTGHDLTARRDLDSYVGELLADWEDTVAWPAEQWRIVRGVEAFKGHGGFEACGVSCG